MNVSKYGSCKYSAVSKTYVYLTCFFSFAMPHFLLLIAKNMSNSSTISRAEDFLRHSSTTLRRITMAATMEATSAVLPTTSGRTNSHYVGIGQCERKEYWG